MKHVGPPCSGPRADEVRVTGQRPHTRSDAGRARSPSPAPPSTKSTSPTSSVAPFRIVIEPTASGRKWIARLDDRILCVTAWPFVKTARLLLAGGHPTDAVIEMWRPGTDTWSLRGRIGVVAATIIDGEKGPPRAKNGPPVRFSGMTSTTLVGGLTP